MIAPPERAAQRRRSSKGEWARQVIERALAEEQKSTDPLARLAAPEAPTADIGQMLAEIEVGKRTPTAAGACSRVSSALPVTC